MKRQISEGVKISSSIPSKNSIQGRQSIIAQAAARGLQLSEDGKSWVPINPNSSELPLNRSNVTILTNKPPSNTAASLFVGASILGIFSAVLILIVTVFAPLIFFAFLLWGLLRLMGSDQSFFEFLASFG